MRLTLLLTLVSCFQLPSVWAQSGDRASVGRERGGEGSRQRYSSEGDRGGRSARGRGERSGANEAADRSGGSRFGGTGFGGGPGSFGGGFGGQFGGGFGGGGFGGSPFGGGLADMIRRFDRNANNMIDPDEVVGPAGFFIQRMSQNNPRIDPSRPIPIDLILGEIERFRGGMMGGIGPGMGSEDELFSSAANEPELLVPDFRLNSIPEPIPGFGAAAATGSKPVTERDKAEAEERLRRYDRNRDNFLTPDEMAQGRWSGDPMQFDRNRDGKLSREELASRQAERRAQEANNARSRDNSVQPRPGEWGSGMSGSWSRGTDPTAQGGNRGGPAGDQAKGPVRKTPEERFGDAKSYRISATVSAADNLPSFFLSSDANGDSQVTLKEFAVVISDQTLSDFNKWDLNADGLITRREAIAANAANGGSTSSTASPSPPEATARPTSPRPSESPQTHVTSLAAASPNIGNSPPSASKFSEVELLWAKRQIEKYDGDGDGALSRAEWDKMVVKPHTADTNRDGKITAEEYAAFRATKK